MTRTHVTALSLCAVCLLVGCRSTRFASVPLERAEVPIDADDMPPAAMDALRFLSDVSFTSFEREDRGLYIAYEAEWEEDGVEIELTVLEDGTFLESERELGTHQYTMLPAAVLAKVRELESRGLRVKVAQRAFYLFDIEAAPASTADSDSDDGEDQELELLLRHDGSDATR